MERNPIYEDYTKKKSVVSVVDLDDRVEPNLDYGLSFSSVLVTQANRVVDLVQVELNSYYYYY